MAEPTLRDVLHAFTRLEGSLESLRAETKHELRALREDMATKDDLGAFRDAVANDFHAVRADAAALRGDARVLSDDLHALRADVAVHRQETAETFAAHRQETAETFAAHRQEIAAHRQETAAHRRETAQAFADLDRELARHSDWFTASSRTMSPR